MSLETKHGWSSFSTSCCLPWKVTYTKLQRPPAVQPASDCRQHPIYAGHDTFQFNFVTVMGLLRNRESVSTCSLSSTVCESRKQYSRLLRTCPQQPVQQAFISTAFLLLCQSQPGDAAFDQASGPRLHLPSLWSRLGSSSHTSNVMLGISAVGVGRVFCVSMSTQSYFSTTLEISPWPSLINDLGLPSAGSGNRCKQ